jgi:hypothetical protein
MHNVIPLRRARAANDEAPAPAPTPAAPAHEALDAMGPVPTPLPGSAAGHLARIQAVADDFALMYRPLWTRLILWPSAHTVQQFSFWFMVGGVIGAIASCTQGG